MITSSMSSGQRHQYVRQLALALQFWGSETESIHHTFVRSSNSPFSLEPICKDHFRDHAKGHSFHVSGTPKTSDLDELDYVNIVTSLVSSTYLLHTFFSRHHPVKQDIKHEKEKFSRQLLFWDMVFLFEKKKSKIL